MNKYLIDFNNMSWESAYPGQKQKTYIGKDQRIRLVELSDKYGEEDWCEKEHIGYVLEGRLTIIFNGKSVTYNKGDGILIPPGQANRHKGKIAKDEKVLMIFFER